MPIYYWFIIPNHDTTVKKEIYHQLLQYYIQQKSTIISDYKKILSSTYPNDRIFISPISYNER